MAELLQQGRRKVITYGGLQSNHARMTAAACAAHGLEAHLFFFEKRPAQLQGNLLVDSLCGARMHYIPFGGGSAGAMSLETTNRLVRLLALALVGPGAYFIPVGGHNVTGCLGYVDVACELSAQLPLQQIPAERTTLVMAAGTGGTLAGLLAGVSLLESPLQLLGLDIGKLWKGFAGSVGRLAGALCTALGKPRTFQADSVPLIEEVYAGTGYGVFSQKVGRAIALLAETEGILLDPVYTGKAFAGLLDLIHNNHFGREDHVIFLHTGGIAGLWAYEAELAALAGSCN